MKKFALIQVILLSTLSLSGTIYFKDSYTFKGSYKNDTYPLQSYFSLDTMKDWSWNQNYQFTISETGTYELRSHGGRVFPPSAGNVIVGYYSFTKDNTAPSISSSISPSRLTNGNVTVTASATDSGVGLDKIEMKVGSGSYAIRSSVSLSSNNIVTIKATDKLGNYSTETVSVSNIDKVNPTISISSNNTFPTKDSVNVTATFLDDYSGVNTREVKIGNRSWESIVAPYITTFSSNNKIFFRSMDNAGNWSSISSYEVKILISHLRVVLP
ncbi:hypothetical protein EW093_05610 [Thiospirochaeta perfilievii]|uniref:Bacterial Ig-like domain-containing protein n=1 Tax=Thiospirochaeta perfilievii TaxID=252967 RepID=A0A5C1QDB8_9SPIO|nr:hypothetical protein [Thiospirochaeta perfilievii]QEN04202.1 hypothetical protein EW093_05610 [Thiospirochaeta perfilievii]